MKKILCIIICLAVLALTLVSCSRPPEYAEIEERFKELIEKSYSVNDMLFGEGLPVYERVYENEFSLYRDELTNKVYYYYTIEDTEFGTLFAYRVNENLYFIRSETERAEEQSVYRDSKGAYYYKISYNGNDMEKEVSSYEDKESGETYYFYKIDDDTYGTVYEYKQQSIKYLVRESEKRVGETEVFADVQAGYYYYSVEYSEPEYEFYYRESDPDNYSYVRFDCEYSSIELIKSYAETVYSADYLAGVYEMLFTGAVVSDSINGTMSARYYVYEDGEGSAYLLKSDEYESLIKDKRIYDFSTAKVVRPGSSEFVNIEIESYLENTPNERITIRLSMVKQDDGNWYLDNATY